MDIGLNSAAGRDCRSSATKNLTSWLQEGFSKHVPSTLKVTEFVVSHLNLGGSGLGVGDHLNGKCHLADSRMVLATNNPHNGNFVAGGLHLVWKWVGIVPSQAGSFLAVQLYISGGM